MEMEFSDVFTREARRSGKPKDKRLIYPCT